MSAPVQEPAADGAAQFCDQCGLVAADPGHERCATRRTLEPPRFCPQCARRMVVQVDPFGWKAHCSRHGDTHS